MSKNHLQQNNNLNNNKKLNSKKCSSINLKDSIKSFDDFQVNYYKDSKNKKLKGKSNEKLKNLKFRSLNKKLIKKCLQLENTNTGKIIDGLSYNDYLTSPNFGLVVLHEDRVIGFALATYNSSKEVREFIEIGVLPKSLGKSHKSYLIDKILVDSSFRYQGVGSNLYEKVKNCARSLGADLIFLSDGSHAKMKWMHKEKVKKKYFLNRNIGNFYNKNHLKNAEMSFKYEKLEPIHVKDDLYLSKKNPNKQVDLNSLHNQKTVKHELIDSSNINTQINQSVVKSQSLPNKINESTSNNNTTQGASVSINVVGSSILSERLGLKNNTNSINSPISEKEITTNVEIKKQQLKPSQLYLLTIQQFSDLFQKNISDFFSIKNTNNVFSYGPSEIGRIFKLHNNEYHIVLHPGYDITAEEMNQHDKGIPLGIIQENVTQFITEQKIPLDKCHFHYFINQKPKKFYGAHFVYAYCQNNDETLYVMDSKGHGLYRPNHAKKFLNIRIVKDINTNCQGLLDIWQCGFYSLQAASVISKGLITDKNSIIKKGCIPAFCADKKEDFKKTLWNEHTANVNPAKQYNEKLNSGRNIVYPENNRQSKYFFEPLHEKSFLNNDNEDFEMIDPEKQFEQINNNDSNELSQHDHDSHDSFNDNIKIRNPDQNVISKSLSYKLLNVAYPCLSISFTISFVNSLVCLLDQNSQKFLYDTKTATIAILIAIAIFSMLATVCELYIQGMRKKYENRSPAKTKFLTYIGLLSTSLICIMAAVSIRYNSFLSIKNVSLTGILPLLAIAFIIMGSYFDLISSNKNEPEKPKTFLSKAKKYSTAYPTLFLGQWLGMLGVCLYSGLNISNPSPKLKSCIAGLLFIGFVSGLVLICKSLSHSCSSDQSIEPGTSKHRLG